jgi:phosphoribosyl 1,2-cyclic phosphate phosphodiesterase
MTLTATILGCGSSSGVPRLGGPDGAGDWGACDPTNPKNRRSRCSLLVRQKSATGETAILVDTSPDLHDQMLAARCGALDAILITHDHADQTHGLDDVRAIAYAKRKKIDLFTDHAALTDLKRKFGYIFETPPGSGYPPIVTAHQLPEPFAAMDIAGEGGAIPVLAFRQGHGAIHSLGFRFGPIAYSSDVNELDETAFAALEGVDVWIVDALRHDPHVSHANVATALKWIARVKPHRAILTNLHIDLDYEALRRSLPPGVEPAYDGLAITI